MAQPMFQQVILIHPFLFLGRGVKLSSATAVLLQMARGLRTIVGMYTAGNQLEARAAAGRMAMRTASLMRPPYTPPRGHPPHNATSCRRCLSPQSMKMPACERAAWPRFLGCKLWNIESPPLQHEW